MRSQKQKLCKGLGHNLSFFIIWLLLALPFATLAVNGNSNTYADNANISKKVFAQILLDHYGKASTIKSYSSVKTTWNFAITGICKAAKWPVKKTYSSCLRYAKKQGLLVSPLPKRISSFAKIKYGDVVLLLDRAGNSTAAVIDQNTQPTENPTNVAQNLDPRLPSRISSNVALSAAPETTIGDNFFANIKLASPFQSRFYRDEVYFVEGDVVDKTTDEVLIFLCKENQSCDNSANFLGKTKGNGHFKIPVYFNEVGNFQMGIIPGRSGESRVEIISVVDQIPASPNGGAAPTSFSTTYANGQSVFNWDGEGTLTNLIIFQNNERKDYIFRQGIKSFAPPSKDFVRFKKGQAYWLVTQNELKGPTQTVSLSTQDFRKVDSDKIQITSLKESFDSPGHLTFSAKALSKISKRAAVTLPNGKVKELLIGENDIPSQQSFTVELDLTSLGTYIFEINTPEGSAIVNVPIQVGKNTPLLPDFFALHEDQALDPSPITDLNQQRQRMLQLINNDRSENSIPPVTLANDLNAVAQAHSENMVRLNFFAHVDPDKNGPDERRKLANIPTPVRENLGKAASLESAEAGLMRSPIHRDATIDPEMQRVGIGIEKDSEGYYFVTQNFAPNQVTTDDLFSIENELLENANAHRASLGLSQLSNNNLLHDLAKQWSGKMANDDFFALTDGSGQKLLDVVSSKGIRSAIAAYIIQASQKGQLKEELVGQSSMSEASNKNIGIGLGMNPIGEFFMTVIYTP